MSGFVDNRLRRNATFRMRKGSVLMEFVIVAPLYLVILSALFFVGEFVLNRIRLPIADRCLVWSVADRHKTDGGTWCYQYLVNNLFSEAFQQARIRVDHGGVDKQNQFVRFLFGGVENLEIGIPNWVISMVNAVKTFGGQTLSTDDTKSTFSYFENDGSHDRVSIFARVPDSSVASGYSRSKTIAACDLIPSDYLTNVFSDRWILGVDTSLDYALGSLSTNKGGYTPRQLIHFGD